MSDAPFRGRDIYPGVGELRELIGADVQWDRVAALDAEVVRRVVDPYACPLALLPWLAWSLSVDVWDNDWPEDTKRRVIAASPEVHRRKGTRLAVRLALEALGAHATIREWWESSPPERRGTFRVRVHADGSGPVLDLKLLGQLREAIKRSKPKSRVFELEVALQTTAPIVIAGAIRGLHRATLLPLMKPRPDLHGPVVVAGAFLPGVRRMVLLPKRPGSDPALAPVRIAGALQTTTRRTLLLPRRSR